MALNYVKLGRRMKIIRIRRGISQQTLAEVINCSPSYISYIETGRKCMSLETFVAVVNALRVSSDELLMENVDNTVRVTNHEFASLLSDCSEYEKRVMLQVAASVKTGLRENRRLEAPSNRY